MLLVPASFSIKDNEVDVDDESKKKLTPQDFIDLMLMELNKKEPSSPNTVGAFKFLKTIDHNYDRRNKNGGDVRKVSMKQNTFSF